ncbi:acyl-CoA thioesterase [Ectothiorhodospiraceae bacterium WFHF3C12]|nr:acyl-CoA thioesterase [Ectothiorhodospiraceae bacterium WFHF3C12]
MPRQDFRFSMPLRVRWAEVDPQGVVFNGNYLTYFDVGMTEYFRELGFPYPDGLAPFESDLYVVRSVIDYHRPAAYDDELDVMVRTGRLGRTSLQLLAEIHRGDDHLISGELVYVNTDLHDVTSKPIPQPLRERIVGYEATPPAGA